MKKLPVIVIFCYNRLTHLKKTISSLKKNYNFEKYKVYIFSDGPKNIADYKKIQNIRKYIFSLKLKRSHIHQNKTNFGLKKNVIQGLNKIFKKNKSAIIIEDDIVTNRHFLDYMTDAINYYSANQKVGSISGYTSIKSKKIHNYNKEVYFTKRHYSWGWATWSTVWKKFIFEEKKLKKFINNKNLEKFNNIGQDLPILLNLSFEKKINSWSILFDFNCLINKFICVCPKYSLVKNIGFDNSGTHIHQNFLNNEFINSWRPLKFIKPFISDKIIKIEKLSLKGSFSERFKNFIFRSFYFINKKIKKII